MVTGFNTFHLSCGQNPVYHLPVKDVMHCNSDVVCVGPFLCPKVCGYSMVSSLHERKNYIFNGPQNILHVKKITSLEYGDIMAFKNCKENLVYRV